MKTVKRNEWKDYSAHFCQLFDEKDGRIPMYSYDRPSSMIWNGMMNGLMSNGYSEAAAIEWLRSKAARWALDGDFGDALVKMAFDFAMEKAPSLASKKECAKWAKEAA